jgi:TRAP-type C4-dicarboxylate transport system substrate-binding protein
MQGMMIRRRAVMAGAAAGVLTASRGSAATAWQAYTYNPVGTVAAVLGFKRLISGFEKAANGSYSVSMHLGGSLPIAGNNITQAVSQNVIQLADDGFATGNIPIVSVLRLPMLLLSLADMLKAMAVLKPYLDRDYASKGIVVLGQYAYPFQVIWGRRKITSLDDIKGLKLRVTSVEEGEFIRRFGGTSITMNPADVPAALDRGVVDGVLTASSGGGITWKDLLHWRYSFPTSFVNSTFVVNQAANTGLPDALRNALPGIGDEAAQWTTNEMQRQEDAITADMAKGGMVVTSATPEDIARAVSTMQSFWSQWAQAHGPEAVEVLGKIRATIGR